MSFSGCFNIIVMLGIIALGVYLSINYTVVIGMPVAAALFHIFTKLAK